MIETSTSTKDDVVSTTIPLVSPLRVTTMTTSNETKSSSDDVMSTHISPSPPPLSSPSPPPPPLSPSPPSSPPLGDNLAATVGGATVIQSEKCTVDSITNTNTNSSDDVAFTAIRPQPVTTITTTTTNILIHSSKREENWADAVYYCAVPTIIPPPPSPPPSPLGDYLAAAVGGYYSNSR